MQTSTTATAARTFPAHALKGGDTIQLGDTKVTVWDTFAGEAWTTVRYTMDGGQDVYTTKFRSDAQVTVL